MGEASLGGAPSPPPELTDEEEGVGTLRVTVKAPSVCWNTTLDGQPGGVEHAMIRVTCTRGDSPPPHETDYRGEHTFRNVPAGICSVEATKVGYRSTSGAATEVIDVGGTTEVELMIELAPRPGRTICNRQHKQPRNANATPAYLPAIFWHDSFMIVIREIAWLILLVCLIVFTIVPVVDFADNGRMDWMTGGFNLPAMLLMAVALLTHIIFGQFAGIPMLILAGLTWLLMIGLAFAAAFGAISGLPINYVWFPSLCGMWGCFFVWLAIRFDKFDVFPQWPYIFLYALVSVAIAVVIFFVLAVLTNPVLWADTGLVALWLVLTIVVSWVAGLVSGAAGHVINNDGNHVFTPYGEPKLLPYAGYRYCVQGTRGWFSHFETEEFCYDFAVPAGSNVLAIEAGHVVEWRDDRVNSYYDTGIEADKTANYIYVEHEDGSVARYLHLQKDGVRTPNNLLLTNKLSTSAPPVYRNDIHVNAGTVLALAGTTGISRFPHIHLGMYETVAYGARKFALTFKDASVAIHGKRCYTFRPYQSDNADRGPIEI